MFCVTEKFSVRTQSSLPQSSLHSPHTELSRRQLEATAAAAAHSPSESTPLFKKGSGMPRRGRKTWWASRGAAETVRTRTLKPIPTTLVLKSEAVPKKSSTDTDSVRLRVRCIAGIGPTCHRKHEEELLCLNAVASKTPLSQRLTPFSLSFVSNKRFLSQ